MHPFLDHCRTTLATIRGQGRYRQFTPLAREVAGFPVYRLGGGERP